MSLPFDYLLFCYYVFFFKLSLVELRKKTRQLFKKRKITATECSDLHLVGSFISSPLANENIFLMSNVFYEAR